MTYDFQVLFRRPDWPDVVTKVVKAGTPDEAEHLIRALFPGEKDLLIKVGPGIPDIPRVGLDPDEQCYALGVEHTTLMEYKKKGLLPRPKSGRLDLVPLKLLEKFNVEQRLGLKMEDAA